jgi:hypothetical protein
MIALFAALLAGALGNIVERAVYGATESERQRAAALADAQRNGDAVAAERVLAANAVDVGPREMAFTMLPFILVLGGYAGYVVVTRRRSEQHPA